MLATDVPIEAPPNLTLCAYDRLREDLLCGVWAPGAKLPMNQLRQRYGIGASPLREALSRLVSEDLVVYNDQRGFVAASVSAEELQDVVRTRIALEAMALEQALAQRTPQWEEALVLAFHRLSRTRRSVDADSYEENPQWERLHRAFHQALLGACGSPVLLDFCDQLYDRAYRYRQLAARKAYKQRNELDEHRAIFDAVMAGALAEAKALLAVHYERTAMLSAQS